MSFKPKNAGNSSSQFEPRVTVVPKAGPRKARVSLIVDLGTQAREDFEEADGSTRPQKPCQQVAVFADLVQDVVDYGGSIGKAQYRLLLNKQFAGDIHGVNFTATPPKDAKGTIIPGKEWGFHPANLLTKLAKAVGKPEVITTMDVSELLDMPFIADVEVNEKASGKEDKDGNEIIYKNVNFRGASKVPMVETDELDADGNAVEAPATVAPLKQPARCITFDNATAEDIKFIRYGIIKMIKLAEDYAGSNMQRAIEAFEATKGTTAPADEDAGEPESQEPPKQVVKVTPAKPKPEGKPAAKPAAKPAPKPIVADDDADVPF